MEISKRVKAVYTIVPKPDGKDVWLRVGSAFPNRDGSLTVLLDALPVSGRLQVREQRPREDDAREPSQSDEAKPAVAV